jgi:hypothetical protein
MASLSPSHLALERAMNHCRRDEVAEGLVWLARALEVVPEDEAEFQALVAALTLGLGPARPLPEK